MDLCCSNKTNRHTSHHNHDGTGTTNFRGSAIKGGGGREKLKYLTIEKSEETKLKNSLNNCWST